MARQVDLYLITLEYENEINPGEKLIECKTYELVPATKEIVAKRLAKERLESAGCQNIRVIESTLVRTVEGIGNRGYRVKVSGPIFFDEPS